MTKKNPPSNSKNLVALVEKGRRSRWWRRIGSMKKGFSYVTSDNKKVVGDAELQRIRELVIPPAWRYVRISPATTGRLQSIGVDTSGRLQYVYNSKFSDAQQRKKFARIEKLGEYLPQMRKITNEHISLDGFPREKVLAIMTRLINSLYIRLGTDSSVRQFRTFGITTLSNRHVSVRKNRAIFEFVGKGRIKHRKVLIDDELAVLLKELTSIGRGRKLFQYIDDDGRAQPVTPSQINAYIKSATSNEFSAKDFRTWGASLLAAIELASMGVERDERRRQKNIVTMVRRVAEQLGNTPSVCRSSYIHPNILKAYSRGLTIEEFTPRRHRRAKRIEDFEPEEKSLLKLFKEFR